MPRHHAADLNHAVRALVSEEVSRVLEPYRDLLIGLSSLGSARRGPGRPRGSKAPQARRRPAKPARAARTRSFAAGTKVRYNQGRGAFVAEVVSQDDATGAVKLRRVEDGVETVRAPNTLRVARG